MKLILFDIDGTLITDGGAAREAFSRALREVCGFSGELRGYDFSGRTDPQIAHMILRDAGWSEPAVDERLPRLWENYLDELALQAPGRVRLLPGVGTLIAALREEATVMLGLLTGNIEQGARIKLGGAGMNDAFPFGAFGSDSALREELPLIAVDRAARFSGHRVTGRDVVIIGDSIHDIRCGAPHAATTIAIASGKTPAATLRAENPHFLFDSAEQEGLLDAIRGS